MTSNDFPALIKLALWRQKKTQWALAREVDVEPSMLSRYLNGWLPMPIEVRERIAECLGIEQ